MAAYRPLQPAPMDEEPPMPPGRHLLTQKPKRTVTLGACVACRKRKSKCDGIRPTCTCCTQKDTECVYELGPNEKPSQAMKRKNEEMQGELSNLRQVYDFLRLRPEHEALEALRRIRANSPDKSTSLRIQELADLTRQGRITPSPLSPPATEQNHSGRPLTLPPLRIALDSPNSESIHHTLPLVLSFGSEGPTSQRRRHSSEDDVSTRLNSSGEISLSPSVEAALHPIHGSSDPRLSAASNWTRVVPDGKFASLLLAAWHKWEYSYYHFFDWETFLEDMANGRTDFCSELLVNSLLASASCHSPIVDNRSKPFSDNVMTRFYEEARRLWELEEGQDSLPRLQAALCLFMFLGKHGRDKVGHIFLAEACRIANALGLFGSSYATTLKPPHIPATKWENARAVSAWALFNFQITMSFTYLFQPLLLSQPPAPIPYAEVPEKEAFFRSECTRSVIILDCLKTLVDPDEPASSIKITPEQTEVLYLRLKNWYNERPQSLLPTTSPSPENLLTAMLYHVNVVRLLQPILGSDTPFSRATTYGERAQSLSSEAIKSLRQLIMFHDVRHGWENAIPLILHPIMVTSFGSLEEVVLQNRSEIALASTEQYQSILTSLKALIILSSYVFYAQLLFRLLTQACQSLHLPLPTEVLVKLNEYQSEEWTKKAASVVSSQYIADVKKVAKGIGNARMDAIISQWDAMHFQVKPGSESPENS